MLSDDHLRELANHPIFALFLQSRADKKLHKIPDNWTVDQCQLLSDLCVAGSVLAFVSGLSREDESRILAAWFSDYIKVVELYKLKFKEKNHGH